MRPIFCNRWHDIMRRFFFAWILAGSLAMTWVEPVSANAPPQPVAEEKKPEPPKPEPPKVEEPKKVDGSSQVVYYSLAGIATLIIMLLICMPARRE